MTAISEGKFKYGPYLLNSAGALSVAKAATARSSLLLALVALLLLLLLLSTLSWR